MPGGLKGARKFTRFILVTFQIVIALPQSDPLFLDETIYPEAENLYPQLALSYIEMDYIYPVGNFFLLVNNFGLFVKVGRPP